MLVFRSILFSALFFANTFVHGCAILLVAPWFSELRLARLGQSWAASSLWLLNVLCGTRYQVAGREHLPAGPAVVLCNHQSAWETLALRVILPPRQAWVLKRELLRIPVFGWALARYRPIAIDRRAGRQAIKQLLREGQEHLRAGRWVVIFPQGTRVAPGEWRPFNLGGAKLAESAGVPVVPIAHNAGVFWARRAWLKRPGTIQVVIGAPLEPAGHTAAELNATAQAWIEKTLAALPGR